MEGKTNKGAGPSEHGEEGVFVPTKIFLKVPFSQNMQKY